MKFEATLLLASIAVAAAQQHGVYLYPFVEVNYDFVGNGIDIGNAPSPDINGCSDKCLKVGDKCKAYSWSNFNGGTCWLKSSKGQAVFKPGVSSTGVYTTFQMVCQLQQNVDVVGYDLASQPAATAGACCDICKKLDKCRVYSWNNFNNGTCWLKTGHGDLVYKDGVQSASIFPDDAFTPKYYVDKDFVGHDLTAKPGKLQDCAGLCKGVAGCRAYAWNKDNGGTCWLKAKKDQVIDKAGVSAGVIDKPLAVAKETKDNVDYYDNDMGNVPGIPQAEDCIQVCADTPGCGAVTWNNYRGGTCWLKHMKGNEVPKDGVKAFVL